MIIVLLNIAVNNICNTSVIDMTAQKCANMILKMKPTVGHLSHRQIAQNQQAYPLHHKCKLELS